MLYHPLSVVSGDGWMMQGGGNGNGGLISTTVGTLDGGYLRKVPLPRAPQLQSTALVTCAAPRESCDTCYLQVPQISMWSDLDRSHLGVARSMMLPIAPHWIM
jgi:hypothetical protein